MEIKIDPLNTRAFKQQDNIEITVGSVESR